MHFKLICVSLISFYLFPEIVAGQYADHALLKVVETLKKSEGRVTVYYPPEIEKQAKSIQDLIVKAIDYYNEKFGIDFPISVALLGPKEYALYGKEKYGKADPYNEFLPFVRAGPPKIMCLPAINGSALDSLTQLAIRQNPSAKKLKISIPEISQRFTALVGLHELGHQYINELEIPQAVHWFQEMMANFIADAFLSDVSPSDALLWQTVMESYETYLKPMNRTFSGIHKGNQENYVWWQGNITLIAHEVYKKYSFGFIEQLRKLSNVKIFHEDDLSFIIALEEIAPGFEEWGEKYGHITNNDKVEMGKVRNSIRKETISAIDQNMPNPFTATYSNEWEPGNVSYKRMVMDFLKDLETNTFNRDDLLANYIELHLPGTNDFLEKSVAIPKLKSFRSGLNKLKIKLQSVIPLKSSDSNEDWVFVYGNMINTLENGTLQTVDFLQQFRINKEGKINFIKQYIVSVK